MKARWTLPSYRSAFDNLFQKKSLDKALIVLLPLTHDDFQQDRVCFSADSPDQQDIGNLLPHEESFWKSLLSKLCTADLVTFVG